MGRAHPPFALHVTEAPVDVPVASSSASADDRTAPAATFQLPCAITPAVSPGAIAVALPVKSMPIEGSGMTGVRTICRPLIGARRVAPSGSVGAAETVNDVPLMLKRT